MSLNFSDLPEEMVEEIMTHMEPSSLIQTLGSSKGLRSQYLTKEREQQIKRYQLQQHLTQLSAEKRIKRSTRPSSPVSTMSLELASPQLTALLGPHFPLYEGQAVLNYPLFSKWLQVYALLNDLRVDREIMRVDETLARLTKQYTVNEEDSVYNITFNVMKTQTKSVPVMQIPQSIRYKLHPLLLYLEEMVSYLERHPEHKYLLSNGE